MNNLSNNNLHQPSLSNFFRKPQPSPVLEAPAINKKPKRLGTRPNYYIYNKHTQEVLELQRQCSHLEAQQAFSYVARFCDAQSITLWAIIGQLETKQRIRFRKTKRGGEEFEITPDHPFKLALEKIGYNFDKRKPGSGGWKREPSPPKITIKVLGE
jgi:hypothetical protein